MELDTNEFDSTRHRRRTQSSDDSNNDDRGNKNHGRLESEVDFRSIERTNRGFITLVGVGNRLPNDIEMYHLENTLFFYLNNAMSNYNGHVRIKDVGILPEKSTINNIGGKIIKGRDDDDGGEQDNDDGEEEGDDDGIRPEFVNKSFENPNGSQFVMENRNGPPSVAETQFMPRSQFMPESSVAEENTQTTIALTPYQGFDGNRKRRDSENDVTPNYELHLEVLITTLCMSSYANDIHDLIISAINEKNVEIINELNVGNELSSDQKVALDYFKNLKLVHCSSISDDVHADIEDPNTATTMLPIPTPSPTVDRPKRAAIIETDPGINFSTPVASPLVLDESTIKLPPQTAQTAPPIEYRSNAFERYNTISACIFFVTLIVLGFWNMVRLNKKQVDRRRRKVELAKVAYQAPLSMTNGLMDMGVTGRDGIVSTAAPAHSYDISALDEDRYVGTMDKATLS